MARQAEANEGHAGARPSRRALLLVQGATQAAIQGQQWKLWKKIRSRRTQELARRERATVCKKATTLVAET